MKCRNLYRSVETDDGLRRVENRTFNRLRNKDAHSLEIIERRKQKRSTTQVDIDNEKNVVNDRRVEDNTRR